MTILNPIADPAKRVRALSSHARKDAPTTPDDPKAQKSASDAVNA